MSQNNGKQVGLYNKEYNSLLHIELPESPIYQSQGLIKHIKNHQHRDMIPYMSLIPYILANPDYIGTHPNTPDSMEYVKIIQDNILVAVKLDHNSGQLYVSSMYSITQGKLNNRIRSGRLIKP